LRVVDIAVGPLLYRVRRRPTATGYDIGQPALPGRPAAGVIFHSDRGAQYTSTDFAALARANGVILSVSRKGECWDNAVAESFFATIKRELINDRSWPTRAGLHRAGLHRAVFDYIEGCTTPAGSIPPSAISAPPNTSQPTTTPPDRRHDQLKKPVCQSGSSPVFFSCSIWAWRLVRDLEFMYSHTHLPQGAL
jgi:hypothetical protein